jgi:nicotinamidase/pyrazinamidase
MITINRATNAFLGIDLQVDFMPSGALPVAFGDTIVRPAAQTAEKFDTVILTQDWHPLDHCSFKKQGGPWPIHCPAGEIGAQIHSDFPDRLVTLYFRKGTELNVDSYSGFRDNAGKKTGLAGYLRERGIKRIFVCGLARDFCVKATAIDGAALGFEVYVLDDLTRAVFPESKEQVDQEFQAAGVRIITSSMLSTA